MFVILEVLKQALKKLCETAENLGMDEQYFARRSALYAYRFAEVAMYLLVWLGAALACYVPVLLGVAALAALDIAGETFGASVFVVSALVSSLLGILASFLAFVACAPRSYFLERRA